MSKAIAWQRSKAAEEDTASLNALIASGMEFHAISNDVRAQLKSATSGVVGELKKKIGSEIIDAVLKELN